MLTTLKRSFIHIGVNHMRLHESLRKRLSIGFVSTLRSTDQDEAALQGRSACRRRSNGCRRASERIQVPRVRRVVFCIIALNEASLHL